MDRRAQRTRRLLGDALVALLSEKHYDAITVQDILERANVGRTTYYAHYRDKEDLLLSELDRVVHRLGHQALEAGEAASPLLPSLGLFQHVQASRSLYQALLWGRGFEFLMKKVQAQLAQTIEPRLAALVPPGAATAVPLTVLANFVAGTFINLLRWWMDAKTPCSPEEVDAMFWRLVQPTLDALLPSPAPSH